MLLVGALLFCYGPVLIALVGQWLANDIYSYAFLVPVISGYMIYAQYDRLEVLALKESLGPGWIVLGGGLGLLIVGWVGHLLLIQEISLLVTIAGLVLIFLGMDALRVLWVPIAYLLFMMPVWGFLTDPLQMPSRLFSASVAAAMLKLTGLTIYQHGIYLELPKITLEVARECSGVNYLFAVAAIGVPLSLFYLHGWIHRVILLCSALAIAMLANGLRITLIGLVAAYDLSTDSHGPFHILQGLFVSTVGFIGIFAVLWLLRRGESLPSAVERHPSTPLRMS